MLPKYPSFTAKSSELFLTQKSSLRKHDIERHTPVSLGEDKVVPLFPVGVLRIDLQIVPVEYRDEVHNRERAGDVTILTRVHEIDDFPTNIGVPEFRGSWCGHTWGNSSH